MLGLVLVSSHNFLVFVYLTVGEDPYTNYIIDLGMSTNQYALFTGGVYSFVLAISSVFSSYLVDILPRRIIYSCAVLSWSLCLIGISLSNNFTEAFLGHIGVAIFASITIPSCVSMVNDIVPVKYKTTALSVMFVGPLLGIAFASLSTILDTNIGWRHSI